MTPVTGFSLFVLCHNFGLRARAMVRSLALQKNCPVRLNLTIIYCNQRDANLVSEGMMSGVDFPPHLQLVHIDEKKIMRRAMHYAKAYHHLSHTVFCDADLWYPEGFWASYTEALEGYSPGYWSCRVFDISFENAEKVVGQFETLNQKDLAPMVSGARHDRYQGRTGSFQCIPRTLLTYPEDPRSSVDSVDLMFSAKAIELSEDKRPERRVGPIPVYHLGHPHTHYGTDGAQY